MTKTEKLEKLFEAQRLLAQAEALYLKSADALFDENGPSIDTDPSIPLDHIIDTNYQWMVTDYGLERKDRGYLIPTSRLNESFWLPSMAGKGWVNIYDFALMLLVARMYHNRLPFYDGKRIENGEWR